MRSPRLGRGRHCGWSTAALQRAQELGSVLGLARCRRRELRCVHFLHLRDEPCRLRHPVRHLMGVGRRARCVRGVPTGHPGCAGRVLSATRRWHRRQPQNRWQGTADHLRPRAVLRTQARAGGLARASFTSWPDQEATDRAADFLAGQGLLLSHDARDRVRGQVRVSRPPTRQPWRRCAGACH